MERSTSTLIMGTVMIIALTIFCSFLTSMGVSDAVKGRERRTAELHTIQMTEERAQAQARATRETLAINQELHAAAIQQESDRIDLEVKRQSANLYMTAGSAYSRSLASTAWGVGLVLLALGGPAMGLVWLWNRRRPLFTSEGLGSASAALARVVVDVERSRAYGIANKSPDTLSVSANDSHNLALSHKNHQDITGGDNLPALTASAPSFRELLESGKVGKGKPVIFGMEEGTALTGTWEDIHSAAIAGLTGSGKTTTVRSWICQAALHEARFAVIDTHSGKKNDSLIYTLSPLRDQIDYIATVRGKVPEFVTAVEAELDRRTVLGSDDHHLFFLLVEELTSLMKFPEIEKPLARLIERIAQEGRGFNMHTLAIGQVWQATRSGGTELRGSLPTSSVHRSKREIARLLIPPDVAIDAPNLGVGNSILSLADGTIHYVATPNTTQEDVIRVAEKIGSENTSQPLRSRFSATSQREKSTSQVVEGSFREVPAYESPRQENGYSDFNKLAEQTERNEVLKLADMGWSMSRIIKQVWGAKGGNAYYEARAKYKEYLGK